MDFLELAKNEFENLVRLRRHFHEYPECGPDEQLNTLSFIESELDKYGIKYKRISHGGILGFINKNLNKTGKTVLLRSDTDALPIQEDSKNLLQEKICVSKIKGVSHACGHDAHLAMLLTEAKILKQNENRLNGCVVLMFEESEETKVETEQICKYIEENNIKIDTSYATHVRWDINAGKVCVNDSIAMHGFCIFKIQINGLGGHGSRPDLCHSPIDCFNDFYTELRNTLKIDVQSQTNRFTWSIGQLSSGNAENIIPEELNCAGTFRFSDSTDGLEAIKKIKEVLEKTCKKNKCDFNFSTEQFLPPVTNYNVCASIAKSAIKNLKNDIYAECEPWMASETFSYLSNMIPSVFSFTGIKNEKIGCGANHHTPKFDIDENGMIFGTAAALSYVFAFLDNEVDLSNFKKAQPTFEKFINQLHKIN